ncbi:MAG: hypothetical protein K2O39_04575 [Clostridiales bacterium]|nr:hypothetical protein [Clostridiales bacterium]
MDNKNINAAVYVFTCIVLLGLWLITIGMFASYVDIDVLVPVPEVSGWFNDSIDVFDASWKMFDGASPLFIILSYSALIVGLVIVAVDATIKQKLKKKVKGLNYAGLAITVVSFVLLIVSMVITKKSVQTAMNKLFLSLIEQSGQTGGMSNQQITLLLNLMFRYDLGMGSIMAIIGGVIAIIGSILLVIPIFDPIKAAASTGTPTAPTNSGYTLQLPTEPSVGGLASVKPFDPNAADNTNSTNDGNDTNS